MAEPVVGLLDVVAANLSAVGGLNGGVKSPLHQIDPLPLNQSCRRQSCRRQSCRRRLPAGPECANLPVMNQQTELPTSKPGDRCPFCSEGVLVPSPSGLNLLCSTCDRITLLPLAHKPDDD